MAFSFDFDLGNVVDLIPSVLGTFFDNKTAKETNKANVQASEGTIEDALASREEARRALTGTAGDVGTVQTADGGFNSQFTPGTSSSILKQGDIGRANTSNALNENFKFNVPDLGTAQGIVDRDNALAQRSFDEQFNKATLRQTQEGGQGGLGAENANFNPRLADTMARIADDFRLNREQNADAFLNSSQAGQLNNLQNAIASNQAQAPSIAGVGGTASAIPSQIPLAPQTPDLGGTLNTASGSNFLRELQQRQALEAEQAKSDELINRLLTSGAFNSGGINT